MGNKNRQHVSTVILTAALLMFAGFHFLPGLNSKTGGWEIWPQIGDLIIHPSRLQHMGGQEATIVAAFLNFSFLIVVSPFLKSVWPKSRWAWGGATIFSGLSAAAFLFVYLVETADDTDQSLGPGGWCLLVAPFMNFIGLLIAKPAYRARSSNPFQ